MRLTNEQRHAIADTARDLFAPGTTVLLFGSRVDDHRRGGDIDLLIETPEPMTPAQLVDHRARFVSRLYCVLDEQRIDAVITARHQADARPIVANAKRTGVLLAQL